MSSVLYLHHVTGLIADGIHVHPAVIELIWRSMGATGLNLIAFTGRRPDQALRTVTEVPARVLGLRDRGQLAPGFRADMVLLTADLHVAATFCNGVCAFAQ
jgi:N-acetylglucosamine-6-phosphate deacetylase